MRSFISAGLDKLVWLHSFPCVFSFQVYHLASVRLRDLCLKLDVSNDLRRKIWTCFEFTLVHCADLMKDRHLDQLLLCAFYIMAKVTHSFKKLMEFYVQLKASGVFSVYSLTDSFMSYYWREVDEVPVWFFPCFAYLSSLAYWWKFLTEFFFSSCVHSQWALVDTNKALCGLIALYLFSVPFIILTIYITWAKNSI